MIIPAEPLHNHDIISVQFNHFYCTEICKMPQRDLALFAYIYLNVDECWLTSSMLEQRFKLQIVINYVVIPENVVSVVLKVVEENWFPVTYILANLIKKKNSIHA